MKRKILLLTLIISIVLFNSCQKKDQPQAVVERVHKEQETVLVQSISKPGHFLGVGQWLYGVDGNDDGTEATKVKAVKEMSLGENILVGEPRKLINSHSGKAADFLEIRRDNGDVGFAFDYMVAEGGRLAVVTDEKASLFKSAKVVDVTSAILAHKSVVVYFPQTETNGFVEVKGINTGTKQYISSNSNFVRRSSLSIKDSDVQSAILLLTALPITREDQKGRREALLKSALEFYSDSVFYDEIFEIMYPNSTSGVINNSNSYESW